MICPLLSFKPHHISFSPTFTVLHWSFALTDLPGMFFLHRKVVKSKNSRVKLVSNPSCATYQLFDLDRILNCCTLVSLSVKWGIKIVLSHRVIVRVKCINIRKMFQTVPGIL